MTRSRQKAFTVIELLIVIGVLAILATLIGFAMTGLMSRQRATATRVTLTNLKSMLAEYEVVAKGLNRSPAVQWYGNNPYAPTNPGDPPLDVWIDGNCSDDPNPPEPDPARTPGNVTVGLSTAGSPTLGRYNSDGVANTQLIIGLLMQAPNNRKMIEQLPASQLMETVPAGVPGKLQLIVDTAGRPNPPIVLDGWGNPIIFVPSGGLAGSAATPDMWIGADDSTDPDARFIVPVPTVANHIGPIKSKDNRPFWASAGPDGDFQKADDNLYSFEE